MHWTWDISEEKKKRMNETTIMSTLIDVEFPVLYWPSFSVACPISSRGSDGNIAVIHLCFPLLGRNKTSKMQLQHHLLKHLVLTKAKPVDNIWIKFVDTHSVCDLSRIWCLSCWPSHSCRWKMKPETPCSFWLRSFTFSCPILACTNTMNFHVLKEKKKKNHINDALVNL